MRTRSGRLLGVVSLIATVVVMGVSSAPASSEEVEKCNEASGKLTLHPGLVTGEAFDQEIVLKGKMTGCTGRFAGVKLWYTKLHAELTCAALTSAGATGGSPGSPIPPQRSLYLSPLGTR